MKPDHLEVLKQGPSAVARWRKKYPYQIDLLGADLNGLDLNGHNFHFAILAETRMQEMTLEGMDFSHVDLREADLSDSRFMNCNFTKAYLAGANLNGTVFDQCCMSQIHLSNVRCLRTVFKTCGLQDACCYYGSIRKVKLDNCTLDRAEFVLTDFAGVEFGNTSLRHSQLAFVNFSACNMRDVSGLELVEFESPCSFGIDTLLLSEGRISAAVLLRAGAPPWMTEIARLCEVGISTAELDKTLSGIRHLRLSPRSPVGSVFISYAHGDSDFVDKLMKKFRQHGIAVFRDKDHLTSGKMEGQISRQIRERDAFVLVLSKHSVLSPWVWHEVELAQKREINEGQDFLFPIARDDAWSNPANYDPKVQKAVFDHQLELSFLKKNYLLPFVNERNMKADFDRLLEGLRQQAERRSQRGGT